MRYLDDCMAEEHGFTQVIKKDGEVYFYKEGSGMWINHIGALRRYMNMHDDGLKIKGYAVETYYSICLSEEVPKLKEKEINLFNFENLKAA